MGIELHARIARRDGNPAEANLANERVPAPPWPSTVRIFTPGQVYPFLKAPR